MTAAATTALSIWHEQQEQDDDRYDEFRKEMQQHFETALGPSGPGVAGIGLFTTDVSPLTLWETYLSNALPGTRQSRNCNACRRFIQHFGGLVTIDEVGNTKAALWPDEAPPAYADAARTLKKLVERANVTGVFRASEAVWGTPVTGPWTHLAIKAPKEVRWTGVLNNAHQEMASKAEEFRMLQRSLADFPIDVVRQAHSLLTSEALYRSEKCEGVAKWLLELHEALAATKNTRARTNIVWRAVSSAPPGYCHVRSGMIGTLLEDISAGLAFETVKRRWADKMNPLQYMRPQAPPSAGNIAQAEKVVAALQSAGALERRFAKLADIQALWHPVPSNPPVKQGGVFGHLSRTQSAPAPTTSNAPPQVMTWVKFLNKVLPTAEQIEFLVPHDRQPYTAMVTAKNPDAPNLLQWDNPVSHYVYSSGSPPSQWNLRGGEYRRVTAVSLRSWMWDETKSYAHHGEGVVFVLEDAKDTTYARNGGMFPEQMKSEYHAVRRTLEAYFQNAVIEGKDEAEACGIALVKGLGNWNLTFRVTSKGVKSTYKLDRWD